MRLFLKLAVLIFFTFTTFEIVGHDHDEDGAKHCLSCIISSKVKKFSIASGSIALSPEEPEKVCHRFFVGATVVFNQFIGPSNFVRGPPFIS